MFFANQSRLILVQHSVAESYKISARAWLKKCPGVVVGCSGILKIIWLATRIGHTPLGTNAAMPDLTEADCSSNIQVLQIQRFLFSPGQ